LWNGVARRAAREVGPAVDGWRATDKQKAKVTRACSIRFLISLTKR
jgi:hypothetical protein